ncbi:hypothetical protein [Pseudomonas sp. R5(2019)]|uniref:hypothetical protein n=1 Tax=Pseudomonas sp. R5(2019) TaxID=2697566 RepID=UPI0014120C01|nr:hypothetical protein [Pseudomonas sp. R5(2019)]NBA94998.1 hypothetical protein [Pseudomonas sp. R5(2019)]
MKRLTRPIINAIELGVDLLGLYGASFSDSPDDERVILPVRVLLDTIGLSNLLIPSDREARSRFIFEVTLRLTVAGKKDLAAAIRLGYALGAYDEATQAESGTALGNLFKLASKVGVAESNILALVKERTSIHQPDQAEVLLRHIHSWLDPLSDSGDTPSKGHTNFIINKINISHSPIGILNTGEIKQVERISVNISTLEKSGGSDAAEAIRHLTEAVTKSHELSERQQSELLDQLEEISRQATLAPDQRSSSGVIKALLVGIATGLGAVGGLAEVWSTWGSTITKFFEL